MNFEYFTFHSTDKREKNKNHPKEDFLIAKDNIFIVCDGVPVLFKTPYPNPSPGAKASEIAANTIFKYLDNNISRRNNLCLAIKMANDEIKKYNDSIKVTSSNIDYLKKQYAATVFACGYILNNTFYFAQLYDCGVIVCDQLGNSEIDIITNAYPYVELLTNLEQKGKTKPGSKEQHIYVRKNIVNNTKASINGNFVNLGVLTGERKALKFVKYGSTSLFSNQIIMLYSDGFIPYIYDTEFRKLALEFNKEKIDKFIKNKEKLNDKYKKEKSLILVRII